MKKISFLGFFLIFVLFLSACSSLKTDKKENDIKNLQETKEEIKDIKDDSKNQGKKIVYTTFFPVYDFTKRIVGDKMEVRTIIKGSQEAHDFELSAKEMVEISKGDLIVYNGAGMESFIDNLKNTVEDENKFLDLSQGLTLLKNKDALQDDNTSINPHTWLSIRNAQIELDTIYRKLSSIDPENEKYYKENLEKSLAEFKALDEKFTESLANVKSKEKYFVVSHAAFNYLANDYGLKQVAVTGISPKDEPTVSQLKTISEFVKKNNISTIFFEGKATPKVAETLAESTGTKTSTLYTMEMLSPEEIEMGYLKLMENNLEELIKSFNE